MASSVIVPADLPASPPPAALREQNPTRHVIERVVEWALLAASSISVLTTLGIVIVLVVEAARFFSEVSFGEFFFDTEWIPSIGSQRWGVWPLVSGTFLIAVLSGLFAVPIGLLGAIYLSEYASKPVRTVVKPALEMLAGIPSVVLGYFALILITPGLMWLHNFGIVPETNVFNALAASLAVAVMIIPMVVSLSEDALRSVPNSLREAAYALGSTKFEVTTRVVVPAAMSGILAAIILAISRAVGETMAVAIASAGMPTLSLNPFQPVLTMTAFMAATRAGDASAGGKVYYSLFAVGLLLFFITLAMNLAARWIVARFREKYE